MRDGDEIVEVDGPPPRLASAMPLGGFEIAVTWDPGTREKEREVVDLTPTILRYRVYAPLKDDPALFATVHLKDHRFGVAWGVTGSIEMGALMIEDSADETMRPEDFDAFMRRHDFTLDAVAAELGVSRRMAAYYRKEHRVPRTVALACRDLDLKAEAMGSANGAGGETAVSAEAH